MFASYKYYTNSVFASSVHYFRNPSSWLKPRYLNLFWRFSVTFMLQTNFFSIALPSLSSNFAISYSRLYRFFAIYKSNWMWAGKGGDRESFVYYKSTLKFRIKVWHNRNVLVSYFKLPRGLRYFHIIRVRRVSFKNASFKSKHGDVNVKNSKKLLKKLLYLISCCMLKFTACVGTELLAKYCTV